MITHMHTQSPAPAPAPFTSAAVLTAAPESWLRSFAQTVAASILPRAHVDPDDWAANNIIFSSPKDPIQGPLDLTLSPFLRAPIRAWDLSGITGLREVTVIAPEQMGKTLTWLAGLLWASVYHPGTALIYYTSETKSRLVNSTKLRPLITNVKDLRVYLDLPNAATASEYRLGPAQINFGGVGSRISSITSVYNIADELDDWQPPRGTSPLDDLRKRSRAFSTGLLYKVCTPAGTERQSKIWREFLNSSQGYWTLRCQGCGGLTMRSCDVHNLQFDLAEQTDAGVHALPIPESIRLICPVCHHKHTESDRPALIGHGQYVHKYPDRINNLGYQIGLLASQFTSGSWMTIATAQCRSGKSGDEEAQRYFDNSIRGLPFKARKLDAGCSRALHIHQVPMPDATTIRWRFLSADTQEDCFYYVVRGVDSKLNSYLLDCGRLETVDALRSAILGQYAGGPLIASIIDEGGHRQDEVRTIARELARVYTYKGNTSIRAHWKLSEDFARLILGHAEFWRVQLLQKIYAAARTPDHYWYTTEAMTDDYIKQLSAWSRPSSGKTADELADGDVSCYRKTDGAADHYFDAEKMCLLLIDYTWQRAIKPAIEQRLKAAEARAS